MKKLFTLAAAVLTSFSLWAETIATTTYGTTSHTYLNVAGTTSNAKIKNGADCVTFGMVYLNSIKASSAWFSTSLSSSNSNITPSSYNLADNGFLTYAGNSTPSYTQAYGQYSSVKSDANVEFWVTGTTGVAIIGQGNGGSKYIVLHIDEVGADGTTLTAVGTDVKQNNTAAALVHASTLNASKYYKVTVTADNTSNNKLGQIRFEVPSAAKHTLTWDFAGGSCSATAGTDYTAAGQVAEGATITYPANNTMSKDGYDFNGWSTTATTMPTSDLTITAQWVDHVLSSDATLANLTVNGETVEGFDPATTEYDVELPFGTSAVPTVVGTANSTYAKNVNVTPAASLPGATTVVVTAEDNSTETYTINFTVAESKVLDLVWKTGQSACAVAGSQSAVIKSDDAKVSSYIKAITFDNAEGAGDDAAEGGSLNTGKKEGNTIIIKTQSGYLFKAMSFFGKIQDAKCLVSIDGGSNWSDLNSTDTGGDATYCDVVSDASTNDIRIKSNGAAGVWIRNMQLTIIKGSITPTALDNTEVEVKAIKRIENGMIVIEKDGKTYNVMGQAIR